MIRLLPFTFLCLAALADSGGVVRSGGLPVPGAAVTASQNGQTFTTYTNPAGEYVFKDLPAGEWKLRVEMFGFDAAEKSVTVPAGEPAAWELTMRQPAPERATPPAARRLQLNRTAQTAELAAQPQPDLTTHSQQDANESFLVSGSLSQGLQFVQQNVMLFGEHGPGAMFGPGGPGGPGPENAAPGFGPGGGPGAAGGPPDQGGPRRVMIGPGGGPGGPGHGGPGPGGPGGGGPGFGPPGGENHRPGPGGGPPWMGERGVALFGNRGGRGRESIRGGAFFSFNDSAFDAKPYSLTGQSIAKPEYSGARFGFDLGGPLRIPKLIDSPNTFFFVNYMGSRSSQGFNALSTVPTALERAGQFSQSIYDPATGLPFPGNAIPGSRISAASRGLLDFIPLPNLPGTVQNYQFVTSTPQNMDNLGVRVSRSLTTRDRLSAGFQLQQRHSETAQTFGFRDVTDGRGLSFNTGWTRNLTQSFINSLRVDFSRNRTGLVPFFANGADVARQLGIQGTSGDPANYGPPNLSFTNFGALSDAAPSLRRDQAAGLNEDVTLIHGKHTTRAGIGYRRNQFNTLTDENGRGSFTFSGLLTSRFDASGNPQPGTGFDMGDFLLGLPQSSSVRYGNSSMYFRAASFNGFVQDDWRIHSNFSLNLGLRYEYSQPVYEKYGRTSNLSMAPGFTGVTLVTPGLIDPDRNNFSPRIGVAWKPGKSFLVRSGYGIYYNGSVYNGIAGRLGQQPPFAFTNSFTTTLGNPLTIETGLLGSPSTLITNTYAVDRGYRVGYAQTWNTALQMDLPHSLVLEIGYLGTKGTRLDTQRLPNQAPPGSPANAENRRPMPYAVGFLWESAEGNSIYHAGQVRLMRRFRRGVSFNALYTYSKSIDNVASFGDGRVTVAQNDKDLAAERGLSAFDQRHVLSTFFVLTSPVGDGPSLVPMHGWKAKLLKDWTLSGGATAGSGTPLTAAILGNRSDASGTGVVGSGRPDSTGLDIHSGGDFFNLLAFTLPAAGAYGNAGKNTIPGPGRFSLNLSAGRSFNFQERRQIEFRVEANNALNTVNLTRYGTTINASNYGLATAAAGMRTMTAQLRFRF